MLFFYRLRHQYRGWLRYQLRRVTPLTWLIWALLASDLAAPGYLRFNLIFTQVDARAIVQNARSQIPETDSLGE